MSLDNFRNISDNMIWKSSALKQLDEFNALKDAVGATLSVVSAHRSKSIDLPVVTLSVGENKFTLRDNFNDLNLFAELCKPATLTLSELFDGILSPLDWKWYLETLSKCRNYSWCEWTDEQLEDDVKVSLTFLEKRLAMDSRVLEKRTRWKKRLTNPEWYEKDWSSGSITYEGEFGLDAKLFVQHRPFAEGINFPHGTPKVYKNGISKFIISLPDYKAAKLVIQRLSV